MDLEKALAGSQNKSRTRKITEHVGHDPLRFRILLNLMVKGDDRLAQHAAWPLSEVGAAHPELLRPHYKALISKLAVPQQHPAIYRGILRMFQEAEVPEKYCGPLFDLCIGFITNPSWPIAVRAFSITVACRICTRFPELTPEFLLILDELQLHPQGAAITVRLREARKALKRAGIKD